MSKTTNESGWPTAKSSSNSPTKNWLDVLTSLSKYFDKPEIMTDEYLRLVYRKALEPMTMIQLGTCLSEAIKRSKFMPKVAELLEFADLTDKQSDSQADAVYKLGGEREWEAVMHHVGRYGVTLWDGEPELKLSGAGEYAFRQIGWRSALSEALGTEQQHWAHKNFLEAYVYASKTDGLRHLPMGTAEARRLLGKLNVAQLPEGKPQ